MKKIDLMKKAFSLIELSIVILIIGILVAGVTQSSRLIKRFKLITAQNITSSSPVYTIKDLAVWYEVALESSFIDIEESDGTQISTWYDNNTLSSYRINLNQTNITQRPIYKENIINGLPSIRFDGSDDFLVGLSAGINSRGFTAFAVGQRFSYGANFQIILSGLAPGFSDDTNCGSFVAFGDFGNTITSGTCLQWFSNSVTNPGNSNPYILSTTFNGSTNFLYLNGSNNSSYNYGNSGFNVDSIRVGCKYSTAPAYFYNGYISEIIIFLRVLTTEERKAVESYLARKYSIKIV